LYSSGNFPRRLKFKSRRFGTQCRSHRPGRSGRRRGNSQKNIYYILKKAKFSKQQSTTEYVVKKSLSCFDKLKIMKFQSVFWASHSWSWRLYQNYTDAEMTKMLKLCTLGLIHITRKYYSCTSQRTYCASIRKTRRWQLYKTTVAVCYESFTE